MEDASVITSLPDDPAILKQIIATRTRERDEANRRHEEVHRKAQQLEIEKQTLEVEKQTIEAEKQTLEVKKLRLEMELLRLKKMYYGPRADRLQTPRDVAQMLLAFAGELESRPVNPADLRSDEPLPQAETARRVRRGRRNLAAFDHLPVIREEHDLPEADKPCPCCGTMREKIGSESSWQVEYIPGHFERIEHVRIKYACKKCEQNAESPQIALADKPVQPIDKGMAGPGLLAYVITSKYADYLPLYRLEAIFQRNGLEIDRGTQSIWCGDVAEIIKPLFDRMVQRILQSHVICTDDTVMPMLWPGKTRQARMWVYVGDEAEKQTLEVKKLRLEMELLRLKKMYYGPRADRLQTPGDVAQMLLAFAGEMESRPVNPADLPPDEPLPEAGTVRRVRRGRRNLASFEHLPVIRQEHDLPEADKPCPCCGTMREKIGSESSWQVEYIPGHFERIEHVRIKYACKKCEQNAESPQIALADKPVQPIDKGMAGPGLLAYVITSKYADYLPLYRLEAIFQRNGLEIDRGTQSIWCGDVAEIIKPLFDRMVQRILQSHVICTDDTVMPMLWPGKTRQARMWVYVGDGHNPYNILDFTLGRSRDGPARFLKDYKQTLLADAYGGYDGVVVGNDITRAGCWAHGRRKFVDAEKTHPVIAQEAVGLIRQLYAVEEQAKGQSDAERLCLRRSQSQPILARLRDRLWAWKDQLLPKHPMAEAVGYVLNQWDELNVFATDGAVPIDNNISEREMKRIVLNRKNSLFVGNQRGGETAAILSSLTSTCRRHEIDPQRYLTQLLTNLPATPASQIDSWLPDQWKQKNPAMSG